MYEIMQITKLDKGQAFFKPGFVIFDVVSDTDKLSLLKIIES